jgi:hypothetical protein
MICTVVGGPYRLSCSTVPPALPSSCSCSCELLEHPAAAAADNCTQNTDMDEITQGRQGPALYTVSQLSDASLYAELTGENQSGGLSLLCVAAGLVWLHDSVSVSHLARERKRMLPLLLSFLNICIYLFK